ncbi:MAG TPA: MlaD family protein [Burkholderiales bacterium]|nr:MlaD family protein [Burkholderiales bacterium]
MESRAHAIVAGLFTVLLGIGVVVAALWFSRENYDHVTYVLESKYSVSGLNPQAPVRLRGVQIGKVQSIDFDPTDARLILITILIKGGSSITRGTTAQLSALGITGTSYVSLEDEGRNPEFLPPATDKASRIAVKRSLFDEFAMSGQEILFEVNKVAKQAQALLSDDNQTQLIGMLGSIQSASNRMAKLAQALEPGAKSLPALTSDARKMIAGADGALREMTPVLQEAKSTLASIDKLAQEYTQRADAFDRVAKNADEVGVASQSVTGAANTMAGDVVPRMNTLLEELARNSRNLDRLLTDLNEHPQGLVFGRRSGKPGPGESGYSESQKK